MCRIRLEFTAESIVVSASSNYNLLVATSVVVIEAAVILGITVCQISLGRIWLTRYYNHMGVLFGRWRSEIGIQVRLFDLQSQWRPWLRCRRVEGTRIAFWFQDWRGGRLVGERTCFVQRGI